MNVIVIFGILPEIFVHHQIIDIQLMVKDRIFPVVDYEFHV